LTVRSQASHADEAEADRDRCEAVPAVDSPAGDLPPLNQARPADPPGPAEGLTLEGRRHTLIEGLPLCIVFALAAFMVVRNGGFAPTVWYPIALLVLGLWAALLCGAGHMLRAVHSRATLAATGLLALFTVWSFASIHWAAVGSDAWQGSNRTVLYLLVFGLLASWRVSSRAIWPLILGVGVVITAEGVMTVEQALRAPVIGSFLVDSRLSSPLGYPNATAALFMLLAWTMFGLATRAWLPAPIRGLALGLVILDLVLSLLGESRGSVFTLPLVVVMYLVLVPGRLRSLGALAIVAIGIAPVMEPVLQFYRADPGQLSETIRHVIDLGLVSAALVGLAGWLFASFDDRVALPARVTRWMGRGLIALALLVALAFVLLANPWHRVESGWHSFEYAGEPSGTAHFSGLGSNRYDFWRVGLIEFTRHPLQGIGTDNFLVPYLQLRRSAEQPVYPHSLLVDLLSQTGLVGTGLFVAFLALATLIVVRSKPGRDGEMARLLVVAASVLLFHGLVDWLWEMPVLGVLGMAWLGTACGLSLRPSLRSRERPHALRVVLAAAAIIAGLGLAASLAVSWVEQRDIQSAEAVWSRNPDKAFSLLRQAGDLNPLDDSPDVLAGAIASRLHRYQAMRTYFAGALARTPVDWYANLELGIAASLSGRPALARAPLREAERLDPHDPVVQQVVKTFGEGRRIDPAAVDRAFSTEGPT
jgi:O-Antigen ligase